MAEYAQLYMNWTLIECFFYAHYYCQRIYLQSWKKNYAVLYSQVASTLLFPFWCWLFMIHWRLAVKGSALASIAGTICAHLF